MKSISEIAKSIDLNAEDIETYGSFIAKITPSGLEKRYSPQKGKYIVVTAITPTSSGEGKTTVAIGLGMAMQRLGKKGIVTLRQPSLGPLFGIKGGGAGGGNSTLLPHEAVNLSLTGDNFRVTAAHNLLSSFIDNHVYRNSPLNIANDSIFWPRAVDINDRALREITVGAKEKGNGFPHPGRFVLTEASEVMAVLSLSASLKDMRERLGRIIAALNKNGKAVFSEDIKCAGAMAVLLKDALRPNMVQTSEGTPVFVHTGPFANIAPGISSIIADKLALSLADYVITEAGFGADLGFEKLIDIKCRTGDLYPDCAVIVCTVRSLKEHGGNPDGGIDEIKRGMAHLKKQIANVKIFRVPAVVTVNRYDNDTSDEILYIIKEVESMGIPSVSVTPWKDGGTGAIELGKIVEEICQYPASPAKSRHFLYELNMPVEEKINRIATTMYGAKCVEFSQPAIEKLQLIKKLGLNNLPVCMAKTQRSLSHDPKLLGAPKDFILPVEDIQIASGAGFIYPICGRIFPLPGLPAGPLGEDMDINTDTWEVRGL